MQTCSYLQRLDLYQSLINKLLKEGNKDGWCHVSAEEIADEFKIPNKDIVIEMMDSLSAENGILEAGETENSEIVYRPIYHDLFSDGPFVNTAYYLFLEDLECLKYIDKKADFLGISDWSVDQGHLCMRDDDRLITDPTERLYTRMVMYAITYPQFKGIFDEFAKLHPDLIDEKVAVPAIATLEAMIASMERIRNGED